jgi:hypothetical protein
VLQRIEAVVEQIEQEIERTGQKQKVKRDHLTPSPSLSRRSPLPHLPNVQTSGTGQRPVPATMLLLS